ncbi:MAG: ComF family protein [Acidobacteria bacterium]|nr:ComF family protein [Acidobacteriota bacterium]
MTSKSGELLRSLTHSLTTAFFPDTCKICELPLGGWSSAPVCAACWDGVRPHAAENACTCCGLAFARAEAIGPEGLCPACELAPPAYDRALSLGRYEGELRSLIHLLKYEGMDALGSELGRRLAALGPRLPEADVVTTTPLHWRRRWQRGFNQSALVAREAARIWKLPFEPGLLRRVKSTAPQAGRTRAERLVNVRGAFQVKNKSAASGRRILLVDDVMTTGATLDACARVLKRAGARSVVAVTLARAVPDRLEVG